MRIIDWGTSSPQFLSTNAEAVAARTLLSSTITGDSNWKLNFTMLSERSE
jgi:hypothetical protein